MLPGSICQVSQCASEGEDLPLPFGLMSDPGVLCKQKDYKHQASSRRQADAGNESLGTACTYVSVAREPSQELH